MQYEAKEKNKNKLQTGNKHLLKPKEQMLVVIVGLALFGPPRDYIFRVFFQPRDNGYYLFRVFYIKKNFRH